MAEPLLRLESALQWAFEQHRGQFRDGDYGLPYISHVVHVVANLRHIGGITDEDMLCAAALHDVVEETTATVADVEARFGKRVASLVGELTREEPTDEVASKLDKDALYALRSDLLLSGIKKMSKEAQTIKLADRLDNISDSLLTRKGKKLTRYVDQTHKMLNVIPKSVNPKLWEAIKILAGDA